MTDRHSSKGKKPKKKIIIITLVVISVILLGIGGSYLYVRNKIYSATKTPEPETKPQVEETKEEPKYEEVKGITNILLIGTDARNLDESARSDSMMIATIDSNNKKIRLTSIMRDTYVSIKGHESQKINGAFAYGGPELLMDTIQRNFNIKLDKYVIINFWGFENVINAVGGLDVDVKNYEISEINKFIGEVDDVKSPPLQNSGLQHLDGQQTLSYARIRQVGNGVYERDSRQRKVISLLLDKLKETSVFQYPNVMSKLLPCVKTNIEPATMLNYAYTVSKFKPLEVTQLQMPMTELSDGGIYKGAWVFLMDKDQNAKLLNDFVFRGIVPDPKKVDLQSFKDAIREYKQNDTTSTSASSEKKSSSDEQKSSSTEKKKVSSESDNSSAKKK